MHRAAWVIAHVLIAAWLAAAARAAGGPPPSGCSPRAGTWCASTNPACLAGGEDCARRAGTAWSFNEGDFCRDCPYEFFIVVPCGTELHLPFFDMEGLDLRITELVTGTSPILRCLNDTALGQGPAHAFDPGCGPSHPGPFWNPPLDVTDNVAPGHVAFSDSTPGDGLCTTQGTVDCDDLPVSGEAPTVVYGDNQVIDCFVARPAGACGVYRVEILSGGFVWELLANCDGSLSAAWEIYFDCTEAWAAYEPLPELTLSASIAPAGGFVQDLRLTVANTGCADHPGSVTVAVASTCGTPLELQVPGPIPAGGSIVLDTSMVLACAADTLTLTLDPLDEVAECSESAGAPGCAATPGGDVVQLAARYCAAVEAGADLVTCADQPVPLAGAAAAAADVLLWSDGGAGGSFVPSDSVLHPTYLPPVPAPAVIVLTLTGTENAGGCAATDDLLLAVLPDQAPVADAGSDVVLDCALASVTVTGAATGGNATGGRLFAWTPPGAVLDPASAVTEAIASGTLALTVTDLATGCSDSDTVVVGSMPAGLAADAGASSTISCTAPSAALSGAAVGGDGSLGYTHAWSPTTGVADPAAAATTTTEPGDYTLTVTDVATGCRAFATVTIADGRSSFTASAGPARTLTCTRTEVVLAGSVSGGEPFAAHAFAWAPAADVSDPAARMPVTSVPGTYTLTVTDIASGCTATSDVVVGEDTAAPTADAGPDLFLDCVSSIYLAGSATGGNGSQGYDFAWIPPAGVPPPAGSPPLVRDPGTYTLVVTDRANGCTATDTLLVDGSLEPPVASAGPNQVITCTSPTVQLEGEILGGYGVAGYLIDWSPAAGLSDPSILQPIASQPGNYTLTLTDVASGCSDTDVVSVNRSVNPPFANAGPVRVLDCLGSPVTLLGSATGGDATLGYAFHWEPAADVSDPDIATPTTSTPGFYTLTVTANASGCMDIDRVQVTRAQPPTVDAGPAARIDCLGPGVLAGRINGSTITTGFTVEWTPAAGVADPSALVTTTTVPGIYTLRVVLIATGCEATDTTTVADASAPPVVDAGADAILACLTPASLAGSASGGSPGAGRTYSWEPAGLVADPGVATTTTSTPGIYTLTVTDVDTGCTGTDTVAILEDPAGPAPEPSAIDQRPGATPLRVARDRATGALRVTWEDVGVAYSLHAGTIAALASASYDHARIACRLALPEHVVAAAPGSRYFLVAGCRSFESSSGRSSIGTERPAALPGPGCP